MTSRMKRMIIAPEQFGTNSELPWEALNDSEGLAPFPRLPHIDYCQMYRDDFSVRVWEPGREALSQPGYDGNDTDSGHPNRGTELPLKATIHGIKGSANFTFGSENTDLGTWYDMEGNALVVDAVDAWNALGGEATPTSVEGGASEEMARRRSSVRVPLFCCMYRGTYKAIDSDAGWEIDSGPADDPATLLALDITNPGVLESSRMDWWDVDYVTLPSRSTSRDVEYATSVQAGIVVDHTMPTYDWSNESRGGWHKYSMDLKANKTMAPGQVLWLHWRTGLIRLPVVHRPAGGNRELVCGIYKGHRFSVAVHASMMVSTKLQL